MKRWMTHIHSSFRPLIAIGCKSWKVVKRETAWHSKARCVFGKKNKHNSNDDAGFHVATTKRKNEKKKKIGPEKERTNFLLISSHYKITHCIFLSGSGLCPDTTFKKKKNQFQIRLKIKNSTKPTIFHTDKKELFFLLTIWWDSSSSYSVVCSLNEFSEISEIAEIA